MSFDSQKNASLYNASVNALTDEQKAAAAKTVARLAGDDDEARVRVCSILGVDAA